VTRAQITGFAVISGARILVPTQLATIEAGVALPVMGTLEVVFELATIGTIVSGKVTASISGGVLDRVGTVSYLSDGKVSATIVGGRADYVGSVGYLMDGRLAGSVYGGRIDYVSTIGSLAEGKVTASISDGRLSASISGGRVDYAGSVGYLMDGRATASISGGFLDSVGTVSYLSGGSLTASICGGSLDYVGTVGVVATLLGTLPVVRRDAVSYTVVVASLAPGASFSSGAFDAIGYPGGIGFSVAYIGGVSTIAGTILYENSRDGISFRPVATVAVYPGQQDDRVFSPTRRYWRFTAVNPSTVEATVEAVVSLMPPGA